MTLAAGQVVTTGTCLVPMDVAPRDEVEVEYGALGRVGIRFAAA
jgi:2-keto-4-pentenoate hydratase